LLIAMRKGEDVSPDFDLSDGFSVSGLKLSSGSSASSGLSGDEDDDAGADDSEAAPDAVSENGSPMDVQSSPTPAPRRRTLPWNNPTRHVSISSRESESSDDEEDDEIQDVSMEDVGAGGDEMEIE
jgi:hypothetical protein